MKSYKEPIRPKLLRSPESILKYLLHTKGRCGLIKCGVCPLSPTQLYNSVEYRCIDEIGKSRLQKVIEKAIEFKVIKESEVFDYLL